MIWQLVVWSGWKSETILPARRHRVPDPLRRVRHADGGRVALAPACIRRLRISILLGTAIGSAVARIPVLRGVRFADHRAPDDAVDRMVPIAICCSSSARGASSSWSCSVPRHRSPTGSSRASTHPAVMLRTGRVARRQGIADPTVTSSSPAHAVVRRRPEAGVGVLVAEPHGR